MTRRMDIFDYARFPERTVKKARRKHAPPPTNGEASAKNPQDAHSGRRCPRCDGGRSAWRAPRRPPSRSSALPSGWWISVTFAPHARRGAQRHLRCDHDSAGHVRRRHGGGADVDFIGKAGVPNSCALADGVVSRVLLAGGAGRLTAPAARLNAFMHPFTAKDLRTWGANVIFLRSRIAGLSPRQALRATAAHLSHEPSVCKRYYVLPQLQDMDATSLVPQGAQAGDCLQLNHCCTVCFVETCSMPCRCGDHSCRSGRTAAEVTTSEKKYVAMKKKKEEAMSLTKTAISLLEKRTGKRQVDLRRKYNHQLEQRNASQKTALDNRIGMLIGGSDEGPVKTALGALRERLNSGTPVDAVADLVGIVESIKETPEVLEFVESADDAGAAPAEDAKIAGGETATEKFEERR